MSYKKQSSCKNAQRNGKSCSRKNSISTGIPRGRTGSSYSAGRSYRKAGAGKRKKKYRGQGLYTIVMLCCLFLFAYGFYEVYFREGNQGSLVEESHDLNFGERQEASGKEQELPGNAEETETSQHLTVHFLDVGQSDCTLLQCGGQTMLIDAGEEDQGTAIQYYLKKQGIERLDYLVLTHPDSDHIGSADVVLTKFQVGRVLMSDFEKNNSSYRNLIDTLEYQRLQPEYPQPGESFVLGSAVCTVLGPAREYEESNNASLWLLVENGEHEFLFTGDAEKKAEKDLLEDVNEWSGQSSLEADVYKAGHHGSDSSSSEALLEAVSPSWAVVSCGEDNSYGHPHEEILERFAERKIQVFRTDVQGTVVAVSDGKEITWRYENHE